MRWWNKVPYWRNQVILLTFHESSVWLLSLVMPLVVVVLFVSKPLLMMMPFPVLFFLCIPVTLAFFLSPVALLPPPTFLFLESCYHSNCLLDCCHFIWQVCSFLWVICHWLSRNRTPNSNTMFHPGRLYHGTASANRCRGKQLAGNASLQLWWLNGCLSLLLHRPFASSGTPDYIIKVFLLRQQLIHLITWRIALFLQMAMATTPGALYVVYSLQLELYTHKANQQALTHEQHVQPRILQFKCEPKLHNTKKPTQIVVLLMTLMQLMKQQLQHLMISFKWPNNHSAKPVESLQCWIWRL